MSDELSRFFGTLDQRLEDARQAEQRVLERFFVELGPRLETARILERELDRQLARRFNVFDYLRTDELGLSKMIGDLLDPDGSHGQGAAFLECLTERLIKEERLEFAKNCDLSRSKVDLELPFKNKCGKERRIDIAVQIDDAQHGKHCLAIESKTNFAVDQPGQVEDYLWWIENKFCPGQNNSKHLIVYLTPTGEGPSEGSVSPEKIRELKKELKEKKPRRLVIMSCGPSGKLDDTSGELDDKFHGLRLSFSLADWLADCRRGCDVDRLRWFLREAETFCRRQYGGTTMTTTENNTVKDFILADRRNMETALAVYQSWPDVAEKIKRDFMGLIREKLEKDAHLLKDIEVDHAYRDKKQGTYICITPKNWLPYRDSKGQEQNTTIRMEAQLKSGINWDIGVFLLVSTDDVNEENKERRQRLQTAFDERGRPGGEWLWWERIEYEYRDWDVLTPRLHQECQAGGGEITNYFVEKFKEVFDWAAPIIDGIDHR